MPERQRMTTRLKALFQRPQLFVLAGGINPVGAKMAKALGYDAFYTSGGNTSAHQLIGSNQADGCCVACRSCIIWSRCTRDSNALIMRVAAS
jgi:hypothetical protein